MADLDLDAIERRACGASPSQTAALVAEVRRLRADLTHAKAKAANARADADALAAEVRRLRAIKDMARFVLAEHDNANARHKADGNALGHCHRRPPRWDDRDGTCTWCVAVAALRHALEADRG